MALFGKKKEAKAQAEAKPVDNSKAEVAKATSEKTETKVVSKTKAATKKASTKKTEKKEVAKTPFTVSKKKGRRQKTTTRFTNNLDKVLIRPRITEKATDVTAQKTYVFEVAVDATKKDVFNAVKEYYKVTPRKVNLVKIPRKKRVNRRNRKVGMSALGKKAYVFLKDGDTIEFV